MSAGAVMSAAEDIEFCVELLPQVSRTFALSIEALPENLREAVRVAYLLCRVVDTIEDQDEAELAWSDREQLFDSFDATLGDDTLETETFERLSETLPRPEEVDTQLCLRSGAVFRRFRALPAEQRNAMRPSIANMSRGMREYAARQRDEGRLRIRSIEDLERYCYFVAGTVGELLTALFLLAHPRPEADTAELRELELRFGLGLQMVNIVKDVADDAEREVTFLPEDLLEARGLTAKDLLEPERRDEGLEVVRAVCARASEHLEAAARYTSLWPAPEAADVRLFCSVPLLLAQQSLDLVAEGGPDVLVRGRNPKVTRAQVAGTLQAAMEAVADQDALVALLEETGCTPRPELSAERSAPVPFETVDHTADLQIRLDAPDAPALYASACLALGALLRGKADLEGDTSTRTIELRADDAESRLQALLQRALVEFETEGFVATTAQVSVARDHLVAELSGAKLPESQETTGHDIKAVTWHDLSFARTHDGRYAASVVFDI